MDSCPVPHVRAWESLEDAGVCQLATLGGRTYLGCLFTENHVGGEKLSLRHYSGRKPPVYPGVISLGPGARRHTKATPTLGLLSQGHVGMSFLENHVRIISLSTEQEGERRVGMSAGPRAGGETLP